MISFMQLFWLTVSILMKFVPVYLYKYFNTVHFLVLPELLPEVEGCVI